MSTKVINARVKQKRDTDSNWQSKNPKLLNGEIILVDTSDGELRIKIGDGTHTYTQLPFSDKALRDLIGDTPVSSQISNAINNHSHPVDAALSGTSENPVQNKVVFEVVEALLDGLGEEPVADQIAKAKYAGSESSGGPANSVKGNLAIKLNGGSTEGTNLFTYNGSAAKTVNITPAAIGAAASSHGTHVTYATDTPKASGTATVGTSSKLAREDHVHPLQTTISGNAATATKATQDGNGKVIADTYATKSELSDLVGDTSVAAQIEAAAYTHPSYTARTGVPTANATPAFGGTFNVSQPVSDASGHITAINSRIITIPSATATTSANGLMSSTDKSKLDGVATGANKTTVDSALSSSSTNPVQNKVINSALAGKVPTTRTVNGKALSADITLTAEDVGAMASTGGTFSNWAHRIEKSDVAGRNVSARDRAIIRTTTGHETSYCCGASLKTVEGTWDIGTRNNDLIFQYATDANFNAGTNTVLTGFRVTDEGAIVVGAGSYGNTLPTGGVAGQVFFKI